NLTSFLEQQIRKSGGPRYEQADRGQRRTRKARRARDAQCGSGWRFVPDGKAIRRFSASAGEPATHKKIVSIGAERIHLSVDAAAQFLPRNAVPLDETTRRRTAAKIDVG